MNAGKMGYQAQVKTLYYVKGVESGFIASSWHQDLSKISLSDLGQARGRTVSTASFMNNISRPVPYDAMSAFVLVFPLLS